MMPDINEISQQQSRPSQNTESAVTHFFGYAATNTNMVVKFRASGMELHIDSDA